MNTKVYSLLEFLRQRQSLTGKTPSFSEMAKYVNVSSKQTIDDWLTLLEREGYIHRIGHPQRRIVITKKGQRPEKITPLNLIQKPQHIEYDQQQVMPHGTAVFNSPLIGGGITLKVKNINLHITKGGENSGTK